MSEEKHATARVLDALQMKGFDGKRDYVASLEARADEQAVSLLVECLCDESSFLRDLAEKALVRMGAEHARPLRPLLTQGLWYTRASVARVLGAVGAREALPELVALLADPNRAIAEAAGDAIVQIAKSGSLVSVARAVHGASETVRRVLLRRAETISPGLGPQLERLLADRELMAADEGEVLRQDAAAAEAQDNVEWEVLASPKRRPRRRPATTPQVAPPAGPATPSETAQAPTPPPGAEPPERP